MMIWKMEKAWQINRPAFKWKMLSQAIIKFSEIFNDSKTFQQDYWNFQRFVIQSVYWKSFILAFKPIENVFWYQKIRDHITSKRINQTKQFHSHADWKHAIIENLSDYLVDTTFIRSKAYLKLGMKAFQM